MIIRKWNRIFKEVLHPLLGGCLNWIDFLTRGGPTIPIDAHLNSITVNSPISKAKEDDNGRLINYWAGQIEHSKDYSSCRWYSGQIPVLSFSSSLGLSLEQKLPQFKIATKLANSPPDRRTEEGQNGIWPRSEAARTQLRGRKDVQDARHDRPYSTGARTIFDEVGYKWTVENV